MFYNIFPLQMTTQQNLLGTLDAAIFAGPNFQARVEPGILWYLKIWGDIYLHLNIFCQRLTF